MWSGCLAFVTNASFFNLMRTLLGLEYLQIWEAAGEKKNKKVDKINKRFDLKKVAIYKTF